MFYLKLRNKYALCILSAWNSLKTKNCYKIISSNCQKWGRCTYIPVRFWMPASPLQKLVKLHELSNMLNNPNCILGRARISTDLGATVFHTTSLFKVFSFHTVSALTSVQSLRQKAVLLIRIHRCLQGYVIPRKNRTKNKHPPKMIYVLVII